jgi:hypothetical protein
VILKTLYAVMSAIKYKLNVNKACIIIPMQYNGYKLSNQRNETKEGHYD